ncbi:MAG: DUF2835 domain-containing protein [Pseudomonadota bacterium]
MTARNRTLEFDLAISADEFHKLYRGTASQVLARAVSGETVRFPARVLRHAVTREGIHGRYRIVFDTDNRFVALERLD